MADLFYVLFLLSAQLSDAPVEGTSNHKKEANDDDGEFNPGQVVGDGDIPLGDWSMKCLRQGEILYDLETYVGQVITDTYPAPVISETSLVPVTRMPERISALVKAAFADVRGIDGKVPEAVNPGGAPPGAARKVFVPEITPPLPLPWPAERSVYNAYARCHLGASLRVFSSPGPGLNPARTRSSCLFPGSSSCLGHRV